MTLKTLSGIVEIRLIRLAKNFPKPYRQILEMAAKALASVVRESEAK